MHGSRSDLIKNADLDLKKNTTSSSIGGVGVCQSVHCWIVQLRNVGANLCVDTKYRNGNERFGLEPCTKDNPGLGGEQVLSLCLSVCLSVTVCYDVSAQ